MPARHARFRNVIRLVTVTLATLGAVIALAFQTAPSASAATFDVSPKPGTAPTWCSADPDATIALFVNGDYLADDQALSWRLVPQNGDQYAAPVATGTLPAGLFLGEADIAKPDGVALGAYTLVFFAPDEAAPVATVPALLADCLTLDLKCGTATFSNPDTNGEATVRVLPAGGGSSEARGVSVPSGGTASVDVSDLTDGFGWIANSAEGEIGRAVLVGPSGSCVLTGSRPVITGEVTFGRTLTVVAGDWTPAPVQLSYRWYRDGRRIPGADDTTHRVTLSDLGHRIKVRVTGSKAGFADVSLTSAATEPAGLGLLFPWAPRPR